jgi:hypothetical protein
MRKLTREYIEHPFKYAAVNAYNAMVLFTHPPVRFETGWAPSQGDWWLRDKFFDRDHQFDSSDWQNSLISVDPNEKVEPAKLLDFIPYGYNYAAVNENGDAYAFLDMPHIDNGKWIVYKGVSFKIEGLFRSVFWQRSLIGKIEVK